MAVDLFLVDLLFHGSGRQQAVHEDALLLAVAARAREREAWDRRERGEGEAWERKR